MTPDAPPPRPDEPAQGPAHERVYKHLRRRLLAGDIAPSAPVTLRGVAADLGVSMTPAREAVRRLAAEGALAISASGRVSAPVLAPARVEELAAIRTLLEPELAARALPRAHLSLVDRLSRLDAEIERKRREGDVAGWLRGDLDWRRTLYLRAHAPAMLALAETVWLQAAPSLRAFHERRRPAAQPPLRRKALAALAAGDESGLRLAVREEVRQSLLALLTPEGLDAA